MANETLQVNPPDSMGGSSKAETTEEILEILDQTDDKEDTDLEDKPKKEVKEKKEEKEEKEEDKEDDKEEKEEEELEEDDTTKEDQVDELITPVALKEITAKYPNLLKEFPFFEKVYYREKKFTEIFPTVQDARDAQERLENVASLEQEVLEGKTDTILKAIKENNPKGFENLVDDYLPALERIAPGAQAHIASNIVRGIVFRMHGIGQQTNNENLKNAALVLSDHFWPGQNPAPPRPFGNGNVEDKKDDKLNNERQAFENQRFEYAAHDLNGRVQNQLKATIDNNIDKANVMTDFIKKNAINEVQSKLEEVLNSDSRFKSHINILWQRAKQGNYSRSLMDNIRSAYLGKAKTVLGPIIVKVRNEALKGVRKTKTEEETNQDRRGPIPTGRSAAESKSSGKSSKVIPQGMSVEDYLMSD